jgi:uncharacterized protein YbaR (Trm112 family)
MAHLSPELLAVLRCPVTGSSLVQEGEELVSSAKDASGRQLRYRIDEGIPVLLPPALQEAGQTGGAQPATDNSPTTPATDA